MKTAVVGCLIALTLGVGTAPTEAATPLTTATLKHQERVRTYHLVVPPGHDKKKAVPLVLALHGGGGNGRAFDRSTRGQMAREAKQRGWIVAFPEGVAKGWNDGRKLRGRRESQRIGVDDVGFLSRLIDRIQKTHGIDRSRVYATGISNGGFMSFRLGIELGAKIAAIAPVTANLQHVHQSKKPTHPMPVLIFNGTRDPLVPYDGGHVKVFGQKRGAILSTDATVAWWCRHNGCAQEPTRTWAPDRAPHDGTRVLVQTHTGPAPVVLYRIEGGGHTWPGGKQYLPPLLVGRVCRDIDATRIMFDFFAKHHRPQVTQKTAATTPR